MPIYRATIEGVKPFLIRSATAAKGKDQIVSLDALTGEEMADALEQGEKIHKAGDPIVLESSEAAPDASGDEKAAEPGTKSGGPGKAAGQQED